MIKTMTGLISQRLQQRRATLAGNRRAGGSEAGFVVVLVAVSILPILALTGLVIDVGRARIVADRLDGATQAGILTAIKTYNGADIPGTQSRLEDAVNINFPAGTFGAVGSPTVDSFSVVSASPLELQVEASAEVEAIFMGMFNWRETRTDLLDVRVRARARRVTAVPPHEYILVQ